MTDVYVGSGDSAPSDAELILEVRSGDLEAYGALYARHAAAARRLAREYTRTPADAEDIVADAFDRVLRVLQHGGGPDLTFRAYLFTVVRRLAADIAKRARRTRPTDDDGTFESALGLEESSEDPTLLGFERSVVARAYRSLPERWQAVLWYMEVENLSPAEIAPILGLTPNGVSALAYRAREGLRVGYLQEHLSHEPADSCKAVNPLLGAYVRGGLAKREVAKVDGHLEGCGGCRTLVLELTDVSHGMRTVIAPLVLGVVGLGALGSLSVGGIAAGASAAAAAGSAATGAAVAGTTATGFESLLVAGATVTVATGAGVAAGGTSGAGLAVTASAVAVAAVGLMTALNALESYQAPPAAAEQSIVVPRGLAAPAIDDVVDDATSPADVPPVGASAELVLGAADPGVVIEPRVATPLRITVANDGGQTASLTTVQLELPSGLRPAPTVSPLGASVGAGDLTAESLACNPSTTAEGQVLCSVGTLQPGEERTVALPVVARLGGTYTIAARVWAQGLETATVLLPTTVSMYGPELTAASRGPVVVDNPGEAWIPVDVTNTGDTLTSDWSVDVTIPAGLVPRGSDGGLDCAPVADRWTCHPRADQAALAPGEMRSGRIHVVADGTLQPATTSASVQPVLAGSDHVVPVTAPVKIGVPWDGAALGAGDLGATCSATGGIDTASAVVTGTYHNTSSRTMSVQLEAAGEVGPQAYAVVPGESATVLVDDGLRVPAGLATWRLTTVVAGTTYSTTVPAGQHGGQECYNPAWDVSTTARTVNTGGTVGVEGTITNKTGETMQVGMVVDGRSAAPVRLGAGETTTLAVPTDKTAVSAGDATFSLYRWVTDRDGDQSASGVVPAVVPTARYDAAALAPRLGSAAADSGECRFDAGADRSYRTFEIPLDNTLSTLPVTFAVTVAGTEHSHSVPGGQVGALSVTVPWGTGTLDLRADGRVVGTVDVAFKSCAKRSWPGTIDVAVDMECVKDSAHVVAKVTNRGSVGWAATIVRGKQFGSTVAVAPGATKRVTFDLGETYASAGTVVLRLERELEGQILAPEKELQHEEASCGVLEPSADLGGGTLEEEPFPEDDKAVPEDEKSPELEEMEGWFEGLPSSCHASEDQANDQPAPGAASGMGDVSGKGEEPAPQAGAAPATASASTAQGEKTSSC